MSNAPPDAPKAHLPTYRELGQAVMVGVYTAAMTFLAGLIGQPWEHWAYWKVAVEAGIAAAIGFLGWTGVTAARGRRAVP